jgi:hypothetical protein
MVEEWSVGVSEETADAIEHFHERSEQASVSEVWT